MVLNHIVGFVTYTYNMRKNSSGIKGLLYVAKTLLSSKTTVRYRDRDIKAPIVKQNFCQSYKVTIIGTFDTYKYC